ncbi:histidine kinase [Pontibacter sp. Tf4]|uniref:sensor histidine kinase n=1 Tax=Pontibacter sp. Tf4 TaxID=2761620 RepID=UPI0016235A7B|nr:histidine kinase [Pontibacter sp. Tf4]MBB6611646.1 histidine kinase [Pontibacter sp. Tf4]
MPYNYKTFSRQAIIAAITALLFYYTFVFINLGTIFFFEESVLRELLLVFLFLMFTFWAHGKLSAFFSKNPFPSLPPRMTAALEGASVILISLVFCLVFVYGPTFILLPGAEILPIRVRLGFVVGAIISLFFYYFVERDRKIKQLQAEHLRAEQLQKENFRTQLESLKNQVNPHFLFNSLNVLHSLIYIDADKAAAFLSQLAEVYRALLQTGDKQLIPLKQELVLANAYISLMQTRFGDNVQFTMDIPDSCLRLELPPTSLQMLLENAIKHNGSTTQKPLLIHISATHDTLVVKNNLQSRLEETASNKVGLQNILSRYSYLTDRQVIIEQSENEFIVKLPLLHVEAYENSNY